MRYLSEKYQRYNYDGIRLEVIYELQNNFENYLHAILTNFMIMFWSYSENFLIY